MRKKPFDMVLFISMVSLLLLGLVMVSSSSYALGAEHFGDRYYFIKRHLLYIFLTFFAFFLGYRLKLSALRKMSFVFLGISLLLLLLVLISPMRVVSGGAGRWLRLGGFSFQPSELVKLTMVLFLAHWATKKGNLLRDFKKGLMFPLILLGVTAALILKQPDFGSAASVAISSIAVLYLAGAKLKHVSATVLLIVPPAIFLIMQSHYRMQRLLAFLDPWKDPLDSGFQIIQSYVAFRSGGLTGQGLGDGLQKIFYLPEVHTDFVFSIIGEELGFVGVALTILLFAILLGRGFTIACQGRDKFSMVLAAGICVCLGTQVATNMAVVMGLLPTKGLTLPLVSFGGSSLLITGMSLGILMNIAAQRKVVRQ
jgi:cell division protein FtsW